MPMIGESFRAESVITSINHGVNWTIQHYMVHIVLVLMRTIDIWSMKSALMPAHKILETTAIIVNYALELFDFAHVPVHSYTVEFKHSPIFVMSAARWSSTTETDCCSSSIRSGSEA